MVICELEEVKVEEGNKKPKVCRPQRHFYGLYNQGSTCYLNSVLQVLFMTTELHDRLDPQSQTIDEALRNLFKELEERTCNTERLTKILQITDVYEQCDAAECLEKILNQVSSQASEIFQGVLRNMTKCFEGHNIIEDTDPFWTLPVSLKDSSDSVLSVKDAFEGIFQPAAYSEGNLVHCSECQMKTEAISVCRMEKSPQILILLLKRFDFNYYLMSYVKSDRRVEVPCTLQTKEKEYELYGIVHDMGSLRYGHYTATILSPEDNAWYKFNDSYINKVEEHLFEQTDTYISSTAYLLIYRASGCPEVEVTHDAQDGEELESEKEFDAEHNKEEPTNNVMEASPLIPQQNLQERKPWCKKEEGAHLNGLGTSSAIVQDEPPTSPTRQDQSSKSSATQASSGMVSRFWNGFKSFVASTSTKHEPSGQKQTGTKRRHEVQDKQQTPAVRGQDVSPNVEETTVKFSDLLLAVRRGTGEKQVAQSGRILHGLYNLGSTSYLNCVLQVLFMTKEIHDRLTETQTDRALRQLFTDLQNKTSRTETITRCLGIDDVNEQCDAVNCLEQILHHISKGASEVFQGKLRCITKCCNDHVIHEETSLFWIFPLSLKHGPDRTYCVETSFQDFFKSETFTENNVFCGKCWKKTKAETQLEMSKCPDILTVLLKTFDFDDRSDVISKCPVKVPRSLKLEDEPYELYGVVDHTGSLRGGHYTATILSSEDNTWYQFNDAHVSRVPEQPFVRRRYYNSQNAYLLMYRVAQSGPHGLYNQGATCYLNSVLQVLFMTKEIHERLTETETETDRALRQLFTDLQNKTSRTETITRCLGIYDVNEQRDAANCLEQILNYISKGASEVFQGKLRCIKKCRKKHTIHEETNSFWTFPLSLKHGPDRTYCVERSFQDFLKKETFDGNNKLFCDKCGKKTKAETRREISKCPDILTVVLKRFDFDDWSHVMPKCPVKVPHSFELEDETYELYGVVDHTGSLRGGHYTATILSSEDNMWYQFDDEHVSKVHEQPFAEEIYYNSQNAYLLMYRALNSNTDKIYQVIVKGPRIEKVVVDLCNTEEEMQKITVLQLKEKIMEKLPDHPDVENLRLFFNGVLNEDSTLISSYGIQHMSEIQLGLDIPGGGPEPPPLPPHTPRRNSLERLMSF